MPDVPVWTDCSQACVFCSNPGGDFRKQPAEYSFARLKERFERHRAGSPTFAKFDQVHDYFTLTGGEPTQHPQFLKVISYLRTEFPERELRVLTNGRRLASGKFVRDLLREAKAPFETAVLLCGPDPLTHERIAGAARGSFLQTVRGIENLLALRGEGQRVEVRVILARVQMPVLRELLDFIKRRFLGLDRVVLIFPELEGRALWRLEDVRMDMRECGFVLDSLYELLRSFGELRLYHFPLCALPERLWPFVWNTLDPRKVVYLRSCRDCPVRPFCAGVHKSYVRHADAGNLGRLLDAPGLETTGLVYHPIAAVRPRERSA